MSEDDEERASTSPACRGPHRRRPRTRRRKRLGVERRRRAVRNSTTSRRSAHGVRRERRRPSRERRVGVHPRRAGGWERPVIRTADVAPLRAALYSDRPGYNLVRNGRGTRCTSRWTCPGTSPSTRLSRSASSTTSPPNVSWALHPDEIAAGAGGGASRWLASAAVMRDWGRSTPCRGASRTVRGVPRAQ